MEDLSWGGWDWSGTRDRSGGRGLSGVRAWPDRVVAVSARLGAAEGGGGEGAGGVDGAGYGVGGGQAAQVGQDEQGLGAHDDGQVALELGQDVGAWADVGVWAG